MAEYHDTVLSRSEREGIVQNILDYLRLNPDVTAIAGTGMSGVPLVSIVCYLTGIEPLLVRRAEDKSHDATTTILTPLNNSNGKISGRYIIVDDFVSSGRTIRHIMDTVGYTGIFSNNFPKAALMYRLAHHHNWPVVPGVSEYYVGLDSNYNSHRFGYTE